MRRLILSIGLVIGIFALSTYNLYVLYSVRADLLKELDGMMETLEASGDPGSILESTTKFEGFWLEREDRLTKFIRHSDLEQITWDSARLPYLSRYGDMSELAAEINRIRLQINHLWETQLPHLRTVF